MNNDIESVLYSKEQIEERMDELSGEITKKYENEMPLIVSVMNGAMIFTSDMLSPDCGNRRVIWLCFR